MHFALIIMLTMKFLKNTNKLH